MDKVTNGGTEFSPGSSGGSGSSEHPGGTSPGDAIAARIASGSSRIPESVRRILAARNGAGSGAGGNSGTVAEPAPLAESDESGKGIRSGDAGQGGNGSDARGNGNGSAGSGESGSGGSDSNQAAAPDESPAAGRPPVAPPAAFIREVGGEVPAGARKRGRPAGGKNSVSASPVSAPAVRPYSKSAPTDPVKVGKWVKTGYSGAALLLEQPHWNISDEQRDFIAGPLAECIDLLPENIKQNAINKILDLTPVIALVYAVGIVTAPRIQATLQISKMKAAQNGNPRNSPPVTSAPRSSGNGTPPEQAGNISTGSATDDGLAARFSPRSGVAPSEN